MRKADIKVGEDYAVGRERDARYGYLERGTILRVGVGKPSRWDERDLKDEDYPEGNGVLVLAERRGRAVFPLSQVHEPWAAWEERLVRNAEAKVEAEAREAEREAAHAAEIAGIRRLAEDVGVSVGTGWASNDDVRTPDRQGGRYEITAEALITLLEAADVGRAAITVLEA